MFGFGKSKRQELDPGNFCKEIIRALGSNPSEAKYRSEVAKANLDLTSGNSNCIISDKFELSDIIYPDMANRMWDFRGIARNPTKNLSFNEVAQKRFEQVREIRKAMEVFESGLNLTIIHSLGVASLRHFCIEYARRIGEDVREEVKLANKKKLVEAVLKALTENKAKLKKTQLMYMFDRPAIKQIASFYIDNDDAIV